jgi:hypothetical protein
MMASLYQSGAELLSMDMVVFLTKKGAAGCVPVAG